MVPCYLTRRGATKEDSAGLAKLKTGVGLRIYTVPETLQARSQHAGCGFRYTAKARVSQESRRVGEASAEAA